MKCQIADPGCACELAADGGNASCRVEGLLAMQGVGVMDWRGSEDFVPLMLVLSGQEKHRLVRSLREIAEALIVAWPTDDGEEYMAAVKTCLDAIYGNIPAK
jgi:hypothetical protein